MKRLWILAALLGAVLPGVAPADLAPLKGVGDYSIPTWFKQSFLELPEEAAAAGAADKHLLLFFGQPGCPYCAELFNNNFSQPHIVDYTRRHFDSIDLNIWGDRDVKDFSGRTLSEKAFASGLKVWFTPSVLVFDKNGKQVLRLNGYYPPHQFLAALQFVAEKKYTRMSLAQYLAKAPPASAAGTLHSEPFFAPPPYDLTQAGGKPLAVFFEQKDCAGCDALHQKIFRQPATLEQLKHFRVVQLDRWGNAPVITPAGEKTTARQWAERLNIAYVPSAVLFVDGQEVIRIEAFLKAFHVQSVLDYAASGAFRTQPDLQRFIRERADHLREHGITVDLWE